MISCRSQSRKTPSLLSVWNHWCTQISSLSIPQCPSVLFSAPVIPLLSSPTILIKASSSSWRQCHISTVFGLIGVAMKIYLHLHLGVPKVVAWAAYRTSRTGTSTSSSNSMSASPCNRELSAGMTSMPPCSMRTMRANLDTLASVSKWKRATKSRFCSH